MRAILVETPGDASHISYGVAARPVAGPRQLLLKVEGTAVNRADTLQRQGLYPVPAGASTIMGLECCGEVVARGADCSPSAAAIGARVMALLSGGGYAQYAVVDEGCVLPIPAGMSYRDASAIPEVFLTAYLIARQLGGLKRGDIVLVHAGASGVGTALIQLCTLFGAHAIVSVSSEAKIKYCLELGAAFGVNYKDAAAGSCSWSDRVKAFTKEKYGREGVDLVLDPVGASHALGNLDALALDGRWILYGTLSGGSVDRFPLAAILRKRIKLEGSTLRNRSDTFKAQLVASFQAECGPALQTALLKPIIEREFNLSEMRLAHELMESNNTIGKVIIKVTNDDE